MIAAATPIHTATINGGPVRFFSGPGVEPDMPWHVHENLLVALQLPRELWRRLRADMLRGFGSVRQYSLRRLQSGDGVLVMTNRIPVHGSRYTAEELALVRLLYPDIDAIVDRLPHRTRSSIRTIINTCKLRTPSKSHKQALWTEAEDKILLSCRGTHRDRSLLLPGRSARACARRFENLGMAGPRYRANFTAAELEQVRAGAKTLPGRTVKAVANLRERLGLCLPRTVPQVPWTVAEIELVRADPSACLPGRSARVIEHMRRKLGLRKRDMARPAEDFWKSVMAAITASVPRGLPYHDRQEAISEIYMSFVENGVNARTLDAKVKDAIRKVYRQYPVLGAHLSLDAPIFDDSGTTIGDRIASDRFHF